MSSSATTSALSQAGPSHEPLGVHSSAGHSIPHPCSGDTHRCFPDGETEAPKGGVKDAELMA